MRADSTGAVNGGANGAASGDKRASRATVALSLAVSFARGGVADLGLMALAVALAVFVASSAAGAASEYSRLVAKTEADPSYLEITVIPSAMARNTAGAVEPLDADPTRGFVLPVDSAEGALAECPSVRFAYDYDNTRFRVGEAPTWGGQGSQVGGGPGSGPGGAGMPGEPPPDAFMAAPAAGAAGTGATAAGTELPGTTTGTTATAAGTEPTVLPPDVGLGGFFGQVQPTDEELAAAAALEKPLLETMRGARVDPAFFEAYGFKAAQGGLFTEEEAAANRAVLVLGSDLAARLYADGQALGRSIRLDGTTYDIVGILEPAADVSLRDWNLMAFSPSRNLRTMPDGTSVRWRPMRLFFAASSADRIDAAVRELETYFERAAGTGAAIVESRKQELDERMAAQGTLFAAAFALSALCVLVAALNLMNATATRALKRRRSLGVLRAIGAGAADVNAASLWETAFPTTVGMVLGGFLAFLLADSTASLLVPYADLDGGGTVAMLVAALLAAGTPMVLGVLPVAAAMRETPADLVRPE